MITSMLCDFGGFMAPGTGKLLAAAAVVGSLTLGVVEPSHASVAERSSHEARPKPKSKKPKKKKPKKKKPKPKHKPKPKPTPVRAPAEIAFPAPEHGSFVQIVAHEDDDLLFINPD